MSGNDLSEWEQLESMSKEDLIIELVKARTALREIDYSLRLVTEIDHPVKERRIPIAVDDDYESGERTSEEWYKRIASYAAAHNTKPWLYPSSLQSYGLTFSQSIKAYDYLVEQGIIEDHQEDELDG